MSWVTNVMLGADMGDFRVVDEFNVWLWEGLPQRDYPERSGRGQLRRITGDDNGWGGPKHPECEVWAGTLNHGDLDAVLAKVRALPWTHPNQVQLFMMDQEQSFFRLWMFRDGELRQYAPTTPVEEDADFFPPWDI
ncbi:hypothetical protein [Actinokineospora globicatena]|uniref:Squamosa promoter-binding protein 15 n=1 Tax=Actinokineospora globicatena TaxID=103729 RepID=A0A9W6QKJ2_9PSEU|nr:hypothetical protein [Actinokineospora globicatena]GLW90262.1 hypothetical protein Aglo03_10780 [Actinokineospora globicatena]